MVQLTDISSLSDEPLSKAMGFRLRIVSTDEYMEGNGWFVALDKNIDPAAQSKGYYTEHAVLEVWSGSAWLPMVQHRESEAPTIGKAHVSTGGDPGWASGND